MYKRAPNALENIRIRIFRPPLNIMDPLPISKSWTHKMFQNRGPILSTIVLLFVEPDPSQASFKIAEPPPAPYFSALLMGGNTDTM